MRSLYKNRFDKQRRDFLKVVTASGLSPKLLTGSGLAVGMMIGRMQEAQAQSGASKSLLVFRAGGAFPSAYQPSGGSLPVQSAPYSGVRNQMNFITGGSMTSGGHGLMFERFTAGSFTEDSFDANMGKTIGANYPLKYLNLGVNAAPEGQTQSQLTKEKTASGQSQVPTIGDSRAAMARLQSALGAGGGTGGGGGGGGGGSTGGSSRQLFVDAHLEAVRALQNKLGQHEREKLDSHMTAIEELESRLASDGDTGGGGGGGTPSPSPAACSSVSEPSASGVNAFDTESDLMSKIGILALRCNITASVSIAFGSDAHDFYVPGFTDVMHQSHHCCGQGFATPEYNTTAAYMSSVIARMLSHADAEGVLNDTLVTQVTDMGDASTHSNTNVPLFVAGAGVRGGSVTANNGRTSADLFQAVSNILGASEHPEARMWSSTPMTGL